MKAKKTIVLLFFLTVFVSGFAQEKNKKQIKEEQKIEKQKEIEALVYSKNFLFSVKMVYPLGMKIREVSADDYSVVYFPNSIKSYLPFFGRGYSGATYGSGDGGIVFEEIPKEYSIVKTKKNYEIKSVIKTEKDSYNMFLSVSFDGGATLNINSNNRSSISYSGSISDISKGK